jgi:cell division septum initiation protein DivIVA
MTQAETDAQNTLKQAQEQASKLIDEHEITRQAKSYAAQIRKNAEDEKAVILNEAKQTADEIMARAQKWSNEIRVAASGFVDDIIKDTESSLANSINEIRSAKQSLHSAIKNNEKN